MVKERYRVDSCCHPHTVRPNVVTKARSSSCTEAGLRGALFHCKLGDFEETLREFAVRSLDHDPSNIAFLRPLRQRPCSRPEQNLAGRNEQTLRVLPKRA